MRWIWDIAPLIHVNVAFEFEEILTFID